MFTTCHHSCCACQRWHCCFCFCVRMDDDSCVIKLIEIVPADNNRNCSESAGVKVSPCHVKICTQYILYYSPILGMVELCFATDFFVFQCQMSETCLRRREIGMDIWSIGGIFLSRSYFLGNAPVKTQNFTMAPVGFSTSPNSDMLKGRSGKLLHIYIQWGLVWQAGLSFGRTLPHFFQRRKKTKKNFTMPMGTFCFFFLSSQKPANGDRGNYWGYMLHSGFSLTHVLVLGERFPILYRGKKTKISRKIFDNVRNWWLTTPEWAKYGQCKTIGFITDYLTI